MNFIMLKKRAAFSMLELVFVIAILGIVSSLGAEIIAQVYDSYLTQRASYRSSIKTQLAVNQIANRLSYAIPETIIARVSNDDNSYVDASYIDTATKNYTVLQWTAYDADSFGAISGTSAAARRPGWSGFADLGALTATTITTPGSNLATTNTIIANLSKDTDPKTLADTALFFPDEYNVNTIGYNGNISGVIKVTSGVGDVLSVQNITGRAIREQYKLAWSAYAVVPMPPASGRDDVVDLYLRYNFQPWNGSYYQDAPSQPLIRDVSVFQFTASINTIRFKICQREYLSSSYSINTCKEKAVIR